MSVDDTHEAETDALTTRPGETPSEGPVRVLYIGGEGRSGSTILSAILGNKQGYLPVGELPVVWHALRTNELCGCERPFANCPFWRAVGIAAFGGWDSVDVETVLDQQARFTRHSRIPMLIMQGHKHRPEPAFRAYCERMGRLYRAIKDVSGCSVIVDSTKSPPSAMLLRSVPNIDLRVVHLVRDSRGVAYSWNKPQITNIQYREHPTLKDRHMTTMRPWQSALWWDIKNLLLHAMIPENQRMLVRYERLTSQTTHELKRIVDFAEERTTSDIATAHPSPTFSSKAFHTLGGNPVRFVRGEISLLPDMWWRTQMPPTQKAIVSGLTLPLLVAYGYIDNPLAHLKATMLTRCRRRT